VGKVLADGHDVGLVQIERGLAWHYKAYEREQNHQDAQAYAKTEMAAKAARSGLWADPGPKPPWEWRKEH
jgi:endonuclease YncB( thermonuclease family)